MPSPSTCCACSTGIGSQADRVNDLLEHLANEQIQEREHELHLKLAGLLPDLPLVQTIAVNRPDGLVLFTANVYPVPPNTRIPDREWIRDLKKPDAPRTHVSKVNIGRLDANLFFGVSRRRYMAVRPAGSSEDYDGVINISIEPNRVSAGFADLVTERSDVVRVIRADGEILAQLPGFYAPLPPLTRQTKPSFFKRANEGRGRALYQTHRHLDGSEQLIALRLFRASPYLPTWPVIRAQSLRGSGVVSPSTLLSASLPSFSLPRWRSSPHVVPRNVTEHKRLLASMRSLMRLQSASPW